MCVIPCSSSARSIALRSVTSPLSSVTRSSSSAVMINSSRLWSDPRSKATTGTCSRTSVRTVQAPMHPSAPVTRNRSSGILVHGYDLRVELQGRAALLVGAVARALDPAERNVHLGAGRLGVHVEHAGVKPVDEVFRRAEIGRIDRGGEAELDGVGPRDRLVER